MYSMCHCTPHVHSLIFTNLKRRADRLHFFVFGTDFQTFYLFCRVCKWICCVYISSRSPNSARTVLQVLGFGSTLFLQDNGLRLLMETSAALLFLPAYILVGSVSIMHTCIFVVVVFVFSVSVAAASMALSIF